MIVQEFHPDGSGSHRLVNTDTGQQTQWASYRQFTYLNGMVGHTSYYGAGENVVPADHFARENAVGV